MRHIVSCFIRLVPVVLGLGAGACQRSTGFCQVNADCADGLVCNTSASTCQSTSSSSDLGANSDQQSGGALARLGTRIGPPAGGMQGDYFGSSVAATSTFAVIGSYLTKSGMGAAYVVDLLGTSAGGLIPVPSPENPTAYDYFGVSVAASGNTLAVGASGKDGNKGAVYVYTKNGSTLTLTNKLVASDAVAGDFFGGAVSLSGDTLVVGAANKTSQQGAAYVFGRNLGAWSPTSIKVPAPTDAVAATYDYFGQQVATNGTYVAVSAPGRLANRGAVYLYTYESTLLRVTPTAAAALAYGNGAAPTELFGSALAMTATTLVIGSPNYTPSSLITAQGAVFLHLLGVPGTPSVVTAPGAGARDRFGAAVSLIASSGSYPETLLIGAPGRNQAFVFSNNLTQWRQAETLEPTAEGSHSGFGVAAVTIGTQHVIGTRGLVQDVGAAYYFGVADN